MLSDLAIEVRGLRKTFRDGLLNRRPVEALKGVTFEVHAGQIFGLLGPNGAGKTTLIKVLLGIIRRSGGEAFLLGHQAGDRFGRRQVGYLPEGHRIPNHHTGNSALEFFGRLSGMSYREIRDRRAHLLDTVGLGKWGATSIRKYSKGMQQRLGLAQAMMHSPRLLMLDEPTDGVDPVGRSQMRELLQRLRDEGKTIFINSHLLQEIELTCDKVAILYEGHLRREASVDELTKIPTKEVTFELVGDDGVLRQVSRSIAGACLRPAVEGSWELCAPFRDQRQLDAYIDQLRRADISIQAVTPLRRTLEQAFLDIVQSEPVTEAAIVQENG